MRAVNECLSSMRLLLACLVVGTGVACGRGGDDLREPPSELVGVIRAVERLDGDVSAFTLESGGETYEILIAEDVDYGFDLSHLDEHRTSEEPVRCTLEDRSGRLYATSILDA